MILMEALGCSGEQKQDCNCWLKLLGLELGCSCLFRNGRFRREDGVMVTEG